MKTTPGHIYFLKERDYLTGETSPYVKIGLVNNQRTTDDRLKEHQTGNPREIIDYATLPMRFVEYSETLLHYIYGEQWITGEWFKLSESELKAAMDDCKRLNEEQLDIANSYLKAIELKTQMSNGSVLKPSEEDIKLHQKAVMYKNRHTLLKGKLQLIRDRIVTAAGNSSGIRGILDTKITEPSTTWDTSSFKEEYPELYEKFCETSTKVKGAFSLQGTSSLKKQDEELDTAVKAGKPESILLVDIDTNAVTERTDDLKTLHLEYIQINRELYEEAWKYEQALYRIQELIDINDEIEGVAKWKREEKEQTSFDKKVLFEAHPEMEEKYTLDKPGSVAYQVRNWREY